MKRNESELNFSKTGWFLICLLPVLFVLIVGTAQTRGFLHQRHAAAVKAAQQLRESQAAAVAARMTVFPAWRVVAASRKRGGADMASYLVSGAGDAEWNGVYVENGSYVGYPAYSMDGSHWMYFDDTGSSYVLSGSKGGNPEYYGGSNSGPDTFSWSVAAGTAPAPTVVEYDPVGQHSADATVNADGKTILATVDYNAHSSDSIYYGPDTGVTGFTITVNGQARAITNAVPKRTGIPFGISLTVSGTIYATDVVTVDYSPGNVVYDVGNPPSTTPVTVAAAYGTPVTATNNSTQTANQTQGNMLLMF